MNRTRLTLFLVGALLGTAWGHGGSFRGPPGAVPPGLREPADPEPPPPPPSDPGAPGIPETGGQDPGETTPPPDGGHATPGENGGPTPAPAPQPPGNGRQGKTKSALSFSSWRYWWAYNNDDILNLKEHIYAQGVSSSSPIPYASGLDATNVRDVLQPTRAEVQRSVIPALERCVDRPREHEDIHGGALVALGKLGSSKHVSIFEEAAFNRYRTRKGARVDFGGQATESAVLALGLLENLDDASQETVRRVLLEIVDDDTLRTRERTWAAVSLGLRRDTGAVELLLERLASRYADDNIPAGILAGLGLVGDAKARPELEDLLRTGVFRGREMSARVRSFAGYALAKIGDPQSLPLVLKVLASRRVGRYTKRSAAIAAGTLGRKATDDLQAEAVRALQRYLRKSAGDATGEHFALIALSRIGTSRALQTLLEVAENGKYAQRPYAALGLGTHVFYAERRQEPVDPDLRNKIVSRLAKLSRKFKDPDTRSAFLLARGLVKDESASRELVDIVYQRSADPVLRGHCCVALGLVGDARKEVKDALRTALRERRSSDLRRDAATGLSLLHDAEAVKVLLQELKKARSFAVQAQIIQAIGTIGDQGALAPLIGILDDTSQPAQTRAMAAVGLGMIGDTRPLPPLARLSKGYNYRASVPDLDELLYIL